MVIAYCPSVLNSFGGPEILIGIKLTSWANISGNKIYLITPERDFILPYLEDERISYIKLDVNYRHNKTLFPWNLFILARKLIRHRRLLKKTLLNILPDIVVSAGEEKYFLPFLHGPWKIVREVHGTKAERNRMKIIGEQIEERLFSKYDRTILLTEEQRNKEWFRLANTIVIPNPCRLRPQNPSTLNHNRIIAVGRLVYEKNHRDLLKAFFTLVGDFPQWRLDIFGNGPKYKELEDQIVAAGLSEKVGLKAPVENIEKELLSSSIFVCTSLFESFSLAIVEAMGCGLPVVSYNCPYGPREIIKDGENGFLVSHGNVNMLAEKLRVLMEDEFIRKKMGGRAREHVKKYSIDVVTKEWRDLFEELTHQPSVGPRQKE